MSALNRMPEAEEDGSYLSRTSTIEDDEVVGWLLHCQNLGLMV